MNLTNRNYGSSIAVVIGFLFLLILPFERLFQPFGLDEFKRQCLGDSVKNIVIIIFGYLLIRSFGYLQISGVTKVFHRRSFLFLVPLYFVLLAPLKYIWMGFHFDEVRLSNVVFLFGAMFFVGLSEEIIFRGFVLPNLIKGANLDQPLMVPILISALMFGILHCLNLLQADSHLHLVLSQVIYATMFGIAFGILLLRTGSLLPLGFIHGTINFSSNWDDLPGTFESINSETYMQEEAISSVLVVFPLLLFTLKIMSKIDRRAIMRLYH